MTDEESRDLQDALVKEAKRICKDSGMDTIQIIGTFFSDGATYTVFAGEGNFSARVGSAREFVIRDEERTRHFVRKEEEES